ncbi:hypothetical protein ElyMa_000952100 [Elysia marginata]|uniref:Uncharacterized protein n=1 Tax=Elysia marginata TaxID=1093978 RepID=A0AAV4HC45_9GAST|nr:hypothetical protein ElyMa_000952100 [Elysia marginata]
MVKAVVRHAVNIVQEETTLAILGMELVTRDVIQAIRVFYVDTVSFENGETKNHMLPKERDNFENSVTTVTVVVGVFIGATVVIGIIVYRNRKALWTCSKKSHPGDDVMTFSLLTSHS